MKHIEVDMGDPDQVKGRTFVKLFNFANDRRPQLQPLNQNSVLYPGIMHCQLKGPYYRDLVLIRTFLAFWVPIGSLFTFQDPYFQCFGFIHAKNVN